MNAVLLGLAVAVGAPNLKDPPPKGLVGRWVCTALTMNGTDAHWNRLEYEFTADGGWVIYRNGKDIDGIHRTYVADPKAGPGAIDLCEGTDGEAKPSRYKVDGDTLRLSTPICDLVARPADFEPGDGLMTFTFRRVKPKD